MPKHRLFCPELAAGPNTLSAAESRHAVSTLRLRQGEPVELFDGVGGSGRGTIASGSSKKLVVDVANLASMVEPRTLRLTLAVAMPRTHRQGFLIEKCSELGVSAIWPMVTARAVVRPGVASIDKWKRRAVEACKQCGNNWLPHIEASMSFDDVLAQASMFDRVILADGRGEPCFDELLPAHGERANLLVLVGPEGGWSTSEREQANSTGAVSVGLGPFTLRTETAAVAVCCAAARRSLTPHG